MTVNLNYQIETMMAHSQTYLNSKIPIVSRSIMKHSRMRGMVVKPSMRSAVNHKRSKRIVHRIRGRIVLDRTDSYKE